MNLVRDFIDIEIMTKKFEIENYSLKFNFPKRTFHNKDEEANALTLEEAGFTPPSSVICSKFRFLRGMGISKAML